ncbi:MAG: hypothetical protein JSR41_02530 [Proteobacteria bacterium]|nr:hypothetical protein [Pseudomonadota bacterium]
MLLVLGKAMACSDITFPERVEFAPGDAELSDVARNKLDRLRQRMEQANLPPTFDRIPSFSVVTGYASPDERYAASLARVRAHRVREHLNVLDAEKRPPFIEGKILMPNDREVLGLGESRKGSLATVEMIFRNHCSRVEMPSR